MCAIAHVVADVAAFELLFDALPDHRIALRALLARNDPDGLSTSKARRAATTWDLQAMLVHV